MKITPLYDRILVRIIDSSNKTKGGLFVPDIAAENSPWRRAEVLAVGHGRVNAAGDVVPLRVQPGDVVAFFRNPSGGEQVVFPDEDGADLLVIAERHVLGVYDKASLPRGTGFIGADGAEITVLPGGDAA